MTFYSRLVLTMALSSFGLRDIGRRMFFSLKNFLSIFHGHMTTVIGEFNF